MPRPVLFFDLAGTLEVRDPTTGLWGAWPGVDVLLHDLAADFDLHLTTGDGRNGAGRALAKLGLSECFAGVHADLPAGGKPFGMIAATLGRRPEQCLAVGDSTVNDTAGDSDRVASVIVDHRGGYVAPKRLGTVVRDLWDGDSFLAGFATALAATDDDPRSPEAGPIPADGLHASALGGGCRLGWWRKTAVSRRAVVLLTG